MPDPLARHLPSTSMVSMVDGVRFATTGDIVPLESYRDQPTERMLSDWRRMSMFFNRANIAMGKNPVYPFDIPPPSSRSWASSTG